jgi:hypothetical protein
MAPHHRRAISAFLFVKIAKVNLVSSSLLTDRCCDSFVAMGIIEDYYGGYESLALFENSDGGYDYDAAYEAQLPDGYEADCGAYYETDPFQRAVNYKTGRTYEQGASDTDYGWYDGYDQYMMPSVSELGPLLPGWHDTGSTTYMGKPIYEGCCSSCQQTCTVPFAPCVGGSPPLCRQCLGPRPAQEEQTAASAGSSSSSSTGPATSSSGTASSSSSEAHAEHVYVAAADAPAGPESQDGRVSPGLKAKARLNPAAKPFAMLNPAAKPFVPAS